MAILIQITTIKEEKMIMAYIGSLDKSVWQSPKIVIIKLDPEFLIRQYLLDLGSNQPLL
jgi:hypothetical protein